MQQIGAYPKVCTYLGKLLEIFDKAKKLKIISLKICNLELRFWFGICSLKFGPISSKNDNFFRTQQSIFSKLKPIDIFSYWLYELWKNWISTLSFILLHVDFIIHIPVFLPGKQSVLTEKRGHQIMIFNLEAIIY